MSDQRLVVPRRTFLAALGLAGGALALGIAPVSANAEEQDGVKPNLFVHVAPSGLVTIVCHRSEMGQGVRSTVPALIADELGADPSRVKIVQAIGDKIYGDQNTDGSSSIRKGFDRLRNLGAGARTMLVAAAAKKWRVPEASCVARDHQVMHEKSKRSLGFGELAVLASKLEPPKAAEIKLRPRGELAHVFRSMPLVDGPDIVTGRAVYGADVRLPGMLIAVVVRPPVVGAVASRFDSARALATPGVRGVFELPRPKSPPAFQPLGGVAVVADDTWSALRGAKALDITWSDAPNAAYDSTSYRELLATAVRAEGKVARDHGDARGALAKAKRRVSAEYFVPHLAHAPMEPPAAIARVDEHGCEVWTCTQNPQAARKEVAGALGLDEAKVTVNVTLLGGGFGRKSKPDYVVEAALLARAAKAPVRVQWTREDDVRHDYFHTTSAQRLEAGLDDAGKVTAWLHRTAFPSISSTFADGVTHAGEGELQQGVLDWPLAIPNVRAEAGEAIAHARIGWLRSVCNIHHAFATGSFLDEIAAARGVDPRDNLLELIGAPRLVSLEELGVQKLPNYGQSLDEHPIDTARLRRVVERVTELARWSDRTRAGRSLGLAVHRSFLTYVAVVASAVRSPVNPARPLVDEAWIVADAATIVNPERAISQFEGAFVFSMSHALYGGITMRRGAVEQCNFLDYPLTRLPDAPRAVHVELVPGEGPPGGVGEPGVPPVAPAIANALFALTGERRRELPLLGRVKPLTL